MSADGVLYQVSVESHDGCHISCTDDLDRLGSWLIRTLLRLNAEHPTLQIWQPKITYFGEARL